mgnify:CR=1 FL=1
MPITFYRKSHYGQDRLYLAAHVSSLTNKATVSEGDLNALAEITGEGLVEIFDPNRKAIAANGPSYSI